MFGGNKIDMLVLHVNFPILSDFGVLTDSLHNHFAGQISLCRLLNFYLTPIFTA